MKKHILICTILIAATQIFAQQQKKEIALEDIVSKKTFSAKTVRGLKSMDDGIHYTKIEDSGTKVVQYAYKTGDKVKVLFDSEFLTYEGPKKITGYIMSPTGDRMLVYTNKQKIYRHSYTADHYVFDLRRKTAIPLSEGGAEQVPQFSPDGNRIAFVKNNDLFFYDLRFKTVSRVTKDGEFNKILNGIPDWVYEEEFGFNSAHTWSPDSRFIAFMRSDESNVKEYSFQTFMGLNPSKDDLELYPGYYKFKYPKAGEENSKVEVRVYDTDTKGTKTMKIAEAGEDYYVPRIKWTASGDKLAIFKLNRHQNKLEMYLANPKSTVAKIAFTEETDTYIADMNYDNYFFLPDGVTMLCLSERDGYNHLYKYDLFSQKLTQITKGDWDVTDFYGYDPKLRRYYFQAAAKNPMQRELYVLDKKGQMVELSKGEGTTNATFSNSLKYYISTFSNVTTPTITKLFNFKGKEVRVLEDNSALKDKIAMYQIQDKQFIQVPTSNGDTLNAWMVKPADFNENVAYPLLMVQYSGPNSQQVLNRYGFGWEQVLANKGFIVACVDGRGTGARGTEFRKCTYKQLGRYESDDQIESAVYFGKQSYIDANRIGIWGWSYGGFMSSLCLSRGNGVFKTGIAVAPVTHYKFYDTIYTERFMRTPKENPEGYENYAPLNLADKLQGRLLLIHGTADDNVHYQNTIEYAEALVQANKQFDMMSYNNRNHSIYGANTRMHLYTKKLEWLQIFLKGELN